MTTLDVYREWLGIQEAERPLNNYQLLRLKKFEDDPAKVRAHYRKMNAHVRKFAAGEFSAQSQELLNELARAMLCLTDRQRKVEYDAGLGRKSEEGFKRRGFEELLLLRKVVDADQLAKVRKFADAVGLDMHVALVQQKAASQEVATQIYAESEGLPYVDLNDLEIDPALVPKLSAVTARQHSCAPLMVDDGTLLMVSANPLRPDVEDDLRLRFDMPIRSVLCTPAAIKEVVDEHYPKAAAKAELDAAGGVPQAAPKKKAAEGDDEAEPVAAAEDDGDDPNKQTRIVAALAIYMVVMFSMLALGYGFLAVPVAAAVGGIVFFGMKAAGL